MPFDVRENDGVLTLTLDTPGAPVNILNHATAAQLCSILQGVTATSTRAIVFETAKPDSFINGVGLLLAHAAQSQADVVAAAAVPWAAYRAVREAKVPTVAVVQGNCFGCGVEFVLNCDYRIAADSSATRFYMTELNDYAFIPLFGSTWNLPEAIGLEKAIDFLLWGERWDAGTALVRGLIDEAAPYEDLASRAAAFVGRVLAGQQSSRRRGRVDQAAWSGAAAGAAASVAVARARRRIAALPPQYQGVYGDALGLLEAGAAGVGGYVAHQERELTASSASALAPVGKAAYSFFYLRQMASERATGRVRGPDPVLRLCVDDERDGDATALATAFRERRLPGVAMVDAAKAELCLVGEASGSDPRGSAARVRVRLALSDACAGELDLYAPTFHRGGRLVELATGSADGGGRLVELATGSADGGGPLIELATGSADGGGRLQQLAQRLARALQRFGWEVARTAPAGAMVSNRLLVAYFAPLVRFLEVGGDPATIAGALRAAGFVRQAGEVASGVGIERLAPLLAAGRERSAGQMEHALAALRIDDALAEGPLPTHARNDGGTLIDALAISLLDAVLTIRGRREVRDTSIVDLIAREHLDFPRHLCSLCMWLRVERIAGALASSELVPELVSEASLISARAFVAGGREFYR